MYFVHHAEEGDLGGHVVVVPAGGLVTPVRDEQVDQEITRPLHDAVSLASVAPFLGVCAKAQERVLGHRQNHPPDSSIRSALRPPSDHASRQRRLHRRDASSLHRERETWPAVQLMEKPHRFSSRQRRRLQNLRRIIPALHEAHRSVIVLDRCFFQSHEVDRADSITTDACDALALESEGIAQ